MGDDKPPLVAHIIYSLGAGGLENGLVNIINSTPAQRYRYVIICLATPHEFSRRITAPNLKIVELHKQEENDLDGSNWKYLSLRKFMWLFIDRYIAVSQGLEQWLLGSIGTRSDWLSQIHMVLISPALNHGQVTALTSCRPVEVKDQAMILSFVAGRAGSVRQAARCG